MRRIATVGTMLCATALLATADTEDTRKRLERELRNIPAPELPAFAANIVRSTPAAQRSQAAIITVETVARLRPTAASSVVAAVSKVSSETQASLSAAAFRAAHHREGHQQGGQGNQNPGPGNGNGNANGGVGHGPGENKPGRPIVHDRPINTVLPNGKPRHFPPDPPRRPVNPPRPHKYNKPHPNH